MNGFRILAIARRPRTLAICAIVACFVMAVLWLLLPLGPWAAAAVGKLVEWLAEAEGNL